MVRNPENSARITIIRTHERKGLGEEEGDWCVETYLLGQAGDGSSVVFEVTPDEVPGGEGGHEAELSRQHSAGHHPGELGGVLACRRECQT